MLVGFKPLNIRLVFFDSKGKCLGGIAEGRGVFIWGFWSNSPTFVPNSYFVTPAQTITLYHPMLHGIAMRIVKCKADAEDIVQDTFLKWLSIEKGKVLNTKAYLVRSVVNNCINHIQALKRKKEECLDHIPELIARFKELDLGTFDFNANVQSALKIVHNKLEPLERAVFVLREVFNFDYEALQDVLEKKKDHCRQLFSRAKRKLEGEPLKINFDWPAKPQWAENFSKACETGCSNDLVKSLKLA